MANSFKQVQEDANTLLSNISKKVTELDNSILSLTNNVSILLKSKGGNNLESQIKQVEAAMKKVDQQVKQREAQVLKESNLRESLYRQRVKEEKDNFNNAVKATRAINQQNAELEKRNQILAQSKAQREAKISKDLTQSMIAQVNAIGKQSDGLRAMNSYYSKLEASSKKLTTQLEREKQARDKAISKQLTGQMRESVDAIGKQSEAMKKMNAYYKELEISTAKEAKAQEKVNKALKEASRPYVKLIAQQKAAKRALQNLIVSQGKNSKETKIAQKEYDILTKKVNQANLATQKFAKKGLSSMAGGFRNLLAAFGVIGGLTLFAQQIKSAFNLARKLDSLNFTMQAVIENSEVLERTQMFLSQTAEQYGASIVTLTERYNKFYTAARQSGVTLEDTEQIFKSFTKSAGFLGLRSHELEGVFLALEQMLSKGKVTTEELRRQLGERLPGAFGVMADTVNKLNPDIEVTVEVLDQMLKKGQILSAEVLPEFARQYEKAIGVDQKDRVETLNASIERLSNTWVAFVGEVTNGEGVISKTMIALINFTTDVVKGFELMTISYDKYLKKLKGDVIADTYTKAKKALEDYSLADEDTVIKELKRYDDLAEKAKIRIKTLQKQNELLSGSKGASKKQRNKEEIDDLTVSLGFYEGNIKAIEEWLKATESTGDADKELADGRRTLAKVNAELAQAQKYLLDSTEAEAPAILARILALNDEKKAWENLRSEKTKELKVLDAQKKGVNSLVKEVQDQIKMYEEVLSITPKMTQSYFWLEKQIENLKSVLEGLDVTDAMEEINEWSERFSESQEKANEKAKEAANALKDYFTGFQDDFFSGAGLDFTGNFITNFDEFENLLDESENAWGVWATSIMEVGQELFNFLNQNQQAYFDTQFSNLEKERDIAIAFAGDSATAREEIERQYEEKRREIQQKQAKAQKEMALFNIAINVAQAIVSTLAQAPGGAISKGVQAAIIGGLGAVQLALVAAQPLPEFFRGTMNSPEGWAMVDEKRPEIHTDNKGNIKSFGEDKANMRWMNQGDKVYTSRESYFQKELGGILDGNDILPYNQMFDMVAPTINVEQGISKSDFQKQIKSLGDRLMSKETSIINLDKKGFTSSVVKGNATKHKQNNILTLRGGIV